MLKQTKKRMNNLIFYYLCIIHTPCQLLQC
jgi:hypothetical protein